MKQQLKNNTLIRLENSEGNVVVFVLNGKQVQMAFEKLISIINSYRKPEEPLSLEEFLFTLKGIS